jgi:hypothetical protein
LRAFSAGRESRSPKPPERLELALRHRPTSGRIPALARLPRGGTNADLIFQVVSRRYEKKSLILTTNLAIAEWHTIFPSATCATALVERVVHHADIVKIEGESYRLRESQLAATTRGNSRPKTDA